MLGHTSRKHTVTDLLRQRKRRPFAAAISELGEYCRDAFGPIDVSQLHQALREYWRTNRVGESRHGDARSRAAPCEYPSSAPIELGSRIKLFAADTHRPLGTACGHPCLDNRPRCGTHRG